MRLTAALLAFAPLAHAADFNPATGAGTVPDVAIAAAFNWSPSQYAASSGSLIFTCHNSCPFTGKIAVTPPSGAAYVKQGPEVVRLASRGLTGSAGAGGATFTGFGGPETVQIPEPKVGDPYNAFGPGYSAAWASVGVNGTTLRPTSSVVATLMTPTGPVAKLIWGN